MSHDAQFADHKDCPYHVSTRDENAVQAAAEQVADRHWRNCSPELVEWIAECAGESIPYQTFASVLVALTREAHLVQTAKGIADVVREDWQRFVTNATDFDAWPLARQMYRETRKV